MVSNAVRSFWLAITLAKYTQAPKKYGRRYYQRVTRFSSALGFMSDVTMLVLGANLKRSEKISARLGDVLSMLYLISGVLKQHLNNAEPEEDTPLVDWACHHLLYQTQEHLDGLIRNFPAKWLRLPLRWLIFPLGKRLSRPSDLMITRISHLISTPGKARSRLIKDVYLVNEPTNPIGVLQEVCQKMIHTSHLRKKLASAARKGKIKGVTLTEQIESAKKEKFITAAQAKMLKELDEMRREVISVDDFSTDELTS